MTPQTIDTITNAIIAVSAVLAFALFLAFGIAVWMISETIKSSEEE